MARYVDYRCPDCNGTFEFLHHPNDLPPPEYCELCNSYMGDDPPKAPVLHLNMLKAKNKVGDKVYRAMEKASEDNAKAAAEMTGDSVADMSAMKITNMKDRSYPGEISAITTAATVAEKNLSYNVGGQTVGPQMQHGSIGAALVDVKGDPELAKQRVPVNKFGTAQMGAQHLAAATANGNMGRYSGK